MEKLVAILLIVLVIGSVKPVSAESAQKNKLGKHYERVYNSVKRRLRLTDEDIRNARLSGKTAFDIGREAGVSEKELRTFIIADAERSIDNVIKKGLMPGFLGSRIKGKVKNTVEAWDGSFE